MSPFDSNPLDEPSIEVFSAHGLDLSQVEDEMGPDQSPTFDLAKIRSDGSDASRNRLSQRNQQK